MHLGTFSYDIHAPSHIQTFSIPTEIQELGIDFGTVVFRFLSNWGEDTYTCVYRVRVHGVEKDGITLTLPDTPEEQGPS